MAEPSLVDTQARGSYKVVTTTCVYCKTELEYIKPKVQSETATPGQPAFRIKCYHCGQTYNGPIARERKSNKNGGRTIGSGALHATSIYIGSPDQPD
jgi:hypothetical protein